MVKGKDFSKFKKDAGKKLSIKVKRVFLDKGIEVTDLSELQNDDMLWISSGEPFYKESGKSILVVHKR